MKHAVFLFRALARVCVAASLLAGAGAAHAERLKDLGVVERRPLIEGRNMIMILAPKNKD